MKIGPKDPNARRRAHEESVGNVKRIAEKMIAVLDDELYMDGCAALALTLKSALKISDAPFPELHIQLDAFIQKLALMEREHIGGKQ